MSDQTSRRTRQYISYTGAPRQVASRAVAATKPGQPLIPAPADRAQCLLEAETFGYLLETHTVFTEYPLGIAYVESTPGSVRLHIENSERGFVRADNLLAGLLPGAEPGGEVHGIAGLRIRQRTHGGIELHRLGHPTSLWLTGLSRRAFERAESGLAGRLVHLNWQPCWLAPGLTAAEERWVEDKQPIICDAQEQNAAWLPSGLLRRLGLFHRVAVPQLVSGYRRLGGGWVLTLDYLQHTALRLGELVAALTDPDHGLPLRLAWHRELDPERSCGTLRLASSDVAATVEVRYDRFAYPALQERPELFAAIRDRISKVSAELDLPAIA